MSDILIIGNEYEDLLLLSTTLREQGFGVRVARSAASGLRAAHAIVPDLVLLDVTLPDQDGFQTCQQLHVAPKLTEVPVIFVSALHDATLKAQAFETGGEDFITKPYHAKEVIVRVQHQLELVRLRQHIRETARLKERQYIARELHDSVSQTLFVLNASVQSLLIGTVVLPTETQERLHNILTLSQSALAEMRTLLYELRPRQIEDTPLHKLLHQLAESFRMRFTGELVVVADERQMPNDIKLGFYRVAQEALNNAAKHARAQQVTIIYAENAGIHRLAVEDDGRGFDLSDPSAGMGLHAMRERAEELGMSLSITSTAEVGTQIAVVWREHADPALGYSALRKT